MCERYVFVNWNCYWLWRCLCLLFWSWLCQDGMYLLKQEVFICLVVGLGKVKVLVICGVELLGDNSVEW